MAAKKGVIGHSSSVPRVELRVLELQAAKEILVEIFGVRVSDVEEITQNRYEEFLYDANMRKRSSGRESS